MPTGASEGPREGHLRYANCRTQEVNRGGPSNTSSTPLVIPTSRLPLMSRLYEKSTATHCPLLLGMESSTAVTVAIKTSVYRTSATDQALGSGYSTTYKKIICLCQGFLAAYRIFLSF